MHYSALISDRWVPATEEEMYVGNLFSTPIIPFICDLDFDKCAAGTYKNLIDNSKNPMRLWAIKCCTWLFMEIPFYLGKPVFYITLMKASIYVTSMPRAPDLELENDITIVGDNLATSRMLPCRS